MSAEQPSPTTKQTEQLHPSLVGFYEPHEHEQPSAAWKYRGAEAEAAARTGRRQPTASSTRPNGAAILRRAAIDLPDRVTRTDLESLLGTHFQPDGWTELLNKFGHDTCGRDAHTYDHRDPNIPYVKVQYVLAYLTELLHEKNEENTNATCTVENRSYHVLLRGHYDVIVIGNGFRESLLALLCAKKNRTVLHITFPKALERLHHDHTMQQNNRDICSQLVDDELSSFTLSELAVLLFPFEKPSMQIAKVEGETSFEKCYTCLGKKIPTAAMTTAKAQALLHKQPLDNCNVGPSADQIGLSVSDISNWSHRIVDARGAGRPVRGGGSKRHLPAFVPHRDSVNNTPFATDSVNKYHISHQPKLLPAAGGIMAALRSTGALRFLDLVPAGVDCAWLGAPETPNPGTRSGAHETAKGIQPIPGSREASLQCEALSLADRKRLHVLLKVVDRYQSCLTRASTGVPDATEIARELFDLVGVAADGDKILSADSMTFCQFLEEVCLHARFQCCWLTLAACNLSHNQCRPASVIHSLQRLCRNGVDSRSILLRVKMGLHTRLTKNRLKMMVRTTATIAPRTIA